MARAYLGEDPKVRPPSTNNAHPLECGGVHMHTHRTRGDHLDRHARDTRQSSCLPFHVPPPNLDVNDPRPPA